MSNKKVIKIISYSEDVLANKDVIKSLEKMLAEAKEGKIVNLGYVMIHKDDSITYGYTNQYLNFTMLGAFEFLKDLILGENKVE